MRTKQLVLLIIGLAITAGIVSSGVADGVQSGFDTAATHAPAVSPDAPVAKVLSVRWWKNGVDQGKIVFDATNTGFVEVRSTLEVIMFRVKGRYSGGSGTGYLVFWDPARTYGESCLLKPGVTSTMMVRRPYMFDAANDLYVKALLPGSGYDAASDSRRIVIVMN
jgi:hypothetical protein